MNVVDFDVAHFLKGHVGLLGGFVVEVLLCNFTDSLNVFFLCFLKVAFLVFHVLNFSYLFCRNGSFAYEVHVLKVGMVEKGRADCGFELLFALYLFVH